MKRSGIKNNARNWKRESKHPVEPPNTPKNPNQCENYPAGIPNFGWCAAACRRVPVPVLPKLANL